MVTLEGEVEGDYQRNAIKTAVESITGVQGINNCIVVKPKTTPADIKQKIMAAFRRSAVLDAEKISVEIIGSTAVLDGKVRSLSEREDAENATWAAPGISKVVNKIELEIQELVL
jgi:osmotically-inducible protein OsmY